MNKPSIPYARLDQVKGKLCFDLPETLSVNLQDSPDRAVFVAVHIEKTKHPLGIVPDIFYKFLDDLSASSTVLSLFFHSEILT